MKVKMMLILLAMVMSSGCATTRLPMNFSERIQNDLSVTPCLYGKAIWLKGVAGYSDMFQPKLIPTVDQNKIREGALVCSEETLIFVTFDNPDKYMPIFEWNIERDITQASVSKWGRGRRLVITTKSAIYTFEIAKDGSITIDQAKTDEFQKFISNKKGIVVPEKVPPGKGVQEKTEKEAQEEQTVFGKPVN
jgi:hypothetical protein